MAPPDSSLNVTIVAVSEKVLDGHGNLFAAVLGRPEMAVYAVRRDKSYNITDGDVLPNSDLLLLELSFSMVAGVAMRLQIVLNDHIWPGAMAQGEVILEANVSFHIDNMEKFGV